MINYNIKTTSWKKDRTSLSEVRRKVFIEEQNVPEDLEWDEFDNDCIHILVTDDQTPIACGRIKPDGHIGRMAVLKKHRNRGIGAAILSALLKQANDANLKKLYLHAQISAIAFYEKQGFKICSEEFMDAGIPHKTMEKQLAPPA